MRVTREGAARTALLALVLAAGCAHLTDVREADGYRRDSAYLYGRFYIDGSALLSFRLACRDGDHYEIMFSHSPSAVKMIKVAPSICQVDYIRYQLAGEMVDFRMLGNEILEPGGVYYIGDFAAESKTDWFEGFVAYLVKDRRDDYAATTAAMKQAFPSFASVRTENRLPRQ
jgi:hypothetical protein